MNKINDNTKERMGRISLKEGIYNIYNNSSSSNDIEEVLKKKAIRTAKVLKDFKNCIVEIYGNNSWVILEKINGVYILKGNKEKNLRKSTNKINRLVVYTNDSLIHSELDSRQEEIKLYFKVKKENIDSFEIYSSKFNMRNRFIYSNEVAQLKAKCML